MPAAISKYKNEIIIILASLIIIRLLFFEVHPRSAVNSRVTAKEIEDKSMEIAQYLSFDTGQYQTYVSFSINQGLIQEYQVKYGVKAGNEYLEKNLKPYLWNVLWKKSETMFFSGKRQLENLKNYIGKLDLQFDLDCNLIALNHGSVDTTKVQPVPKEEAYKIVKEFCARFLTNVLPETIILSDKIETGRAKSEINYKLGDLAGIDTTKEKIDYTFTAEYKNVQAEITQPIFFSVTGNRISIIKLNAPNNDYRPIDDGSIRDYLGILIIAATIILILVLLFRRFRAFEIGLKQGIKAAVIVMLILFAKILIPQSSTLSFNIVLSTLFASIFTGIGVLIIWTISESLCREKWKDKFISIDLFFRGYFLNSRIGNALIKGLSIGMLANAVLLVLYFVFSKIFPISIISESGDSSLDYFNTGVLFLGSITSSVLLFLTYIVFSVSYFKGKIKDNYLIVICSLIFGLVHFGNVNSGYYDYIIQSVIGFILIMFFFKNDVLSSFISLSSFFFIYKCLPIIFISSPVYANPFIILIVLAAIYLIWAAASIFTKDKNLDFDSLAPAFVARITERERLKREFEIAREVQSSFIPAENPILKEIDIAARCMPASEVGGDYYDYIVFDENNLGILIGDVSGKGIQASFYMTLVKGFVKAVSKQTASPSEILDKINILFCENVERGNFITMILAKLNLKNKILTFARAGHNPIIIKNAKDSKTVLYQPAGFALGMEPGTQFGRYMEEENVKLNKGDLIFFYTDGFTEAMNNANEEFTEKRFIKCIEEINTNEPNEIVEILFQKIKLFIGKAPQHDDMTLLVVRIN